MRSAYRIFIENLERICYVIRRKRRCNNRADLGKTGVRTELRWQGVLNNSN
jgi:hypothetical protein